MPARNGAAPPSKRSPTSFHARRWARTPSGSRRDVCTTVSNRFGNPLRIHSHERPVLHACGSRIAEHVVDGSRQLLRVTDAPLITLGLPQRAAAAENLVDLLAGKPFQRMKDAALIESAEA